MFNASLLLQHLLLKELPGASSTDAPFTPPKMRWSLLHAMPIAWQDKFLDASKTTHNSTMLVLQDYIQRQSETDFNANASL
jgi:hypothetical protein